MSLAKLFCLAFNGDRWVVINKKQWVEVETNHRIIGVSFSEAQKNGVFDSNPAVSGVAEFLSFVSSTAHMIFIPFQPQIPSQNPGNPIPKIPMDSDQPTARSAPGPCAASTVHFTHRSKAAPEAPGGPALQVWQASPSNGKGEGWDGMGFGRMVGWVRSEIMVFNF